VLGHAAGQEEDEVEWSGVERSGESERRVDIHIYQEVYSIICVILRICRTYRYTYRVYMHVEYALNWAYLLAQYTRIGNVYGKHLCPVCWGLKRETP